MFILHYRSKATDMKGYNCIGIENPLNSGKFLKIAKIELSSTHQSEVALLCADVQITSEEQNISDWIRNATIGSEDRSIAKACLEPVMLEPAGLLKSASVQDGTQRILISPTDYLNVLPGESIVVRVVPSQPFQTFNTTIIFDEMETSFKREPRPAYAPNYEEVSRTIPIKIPH